MKVATLAASPVVGGKVANVDDSKFKSMPGLQLVVLDDLVAVVGPDFWSASKGLAALNISWHGGANGKAHSDDIWNRLRATSARKGATAVSFGDADKGLTQGERVDVAYELPLLAHAAMEPLNFTVHATPGACEMWGGSQMQTAFVAAAAKTLGIPPGKSDVSQLHDGRRLRPPAGRRYGGQSGAHCPESGRACQGYLDA